MSKRNTRRKKSATPSRERLILIGVIAGAVIIVAFLALSDGGEAAPEVAEARLTLDPVLGSADAPVTIVEYGAYGCSACRAWHQSGIIDQILAQYPGQVRFVFRDFPVIIPNYDQRAAEVAQCALDQGNDQFWDFHDALYSEAIPGSSSQSQLIELGEQVGLDGETLRACVDANTHVATVNYDEQRGRELGLRGTPAFLVNGTYVYNASPDALMAAVEQALAS